MARWSRSRWLTPAFVLAALTVTATGVWWLLLTFRSSTVIANGVVTDCGAPGARRSDLADYANFLCELELNDARTLRAVPMVLFVAGLLGLLVAIGKTLTSPKHSAPPGIDLTDGVTQVQTATIDNYDDMASTLDSQARASHGWSGHAARRLEGAVGDPPNLSGFFAITDISPGAGPDGRVVGGLAFVADPATHDAVRIGGWIDPRHRRAGHMSRACRMFTEHLLDLGASVRAEIDADDVGANAVLTSTGFEIEGRAESYGVRRLAYSRCVAPPDGPDNVQGDSMSDHSATRSSPPWWGRSIDHFVFPALLALFLGALLLALFASIEAKIDSGTVDCGPLLFPNRSLSGDAEWACDSLQNVWRVLALLFFGAALASLLVARRVRRARKPLLLARDGTVVRQATTRDTDAICATIDDDVMTEMGWTEEVRSALRDATDTTLAPSTAVISRDRDPTVIGVISMDGDPATEFTRRIGFWMGPTERGRGDMSRALKLVTEEITGLGGSVIAETARSNIAAQTVLDRAGFTETGTRTARFLNGTQTEAIVYELGPSDAPTL